MVIGLLYKFRTNDMTEIVMCYHVLLLHTLPVFFDTINRNIHRAVLALSPCFQTNLLRLKSNNFDNN